MESAFYLHPDFYMEDVAQLVRALDCGSRGRGFEPHLPPIVRKALIYQGFFYLQVGSIPFTYSSKACAALACAQPENPVKSSYFTVALYCFKYSLLSGR